MDDPSPVFVAHHADGRSCGAIGASPGVEGVVEMNVKQAKSLVKALTKHFGGKAEYEPVNNQGRYRFAITSKQFDDMTHLQRQDAVWKVVDETLPREATLDVSIILAFAPA